jgi:ABC-type amino acid transport substrate-binding protein
MENVYFWNGNKSAARQSYEMALLEACLYATNQEYGSVNVNVDNTDYPKAEDEANIFAAGADILVTVAGNVKFKDIPKMVISQPLTKGLLGYRLLLVKDESLARFSQVNKPSQLQRFSIGIPQTWADAELFRTNHYKVVEKGTLDDLFTLLKNGTFDYVALGVNEIEEIFSRKVASMGGISIEPSLMLYYPFPLVFYVTFSKPNLAQRVEKGLSKIIASGKFEDVFAQHHGDLVQRLNLGNRRVFTLSNPQLPIEMGHFSGSLLA